MCSLPRFYVCIYVCIYAYIWILLLFILDSLSWNSQYNKELPWISNPPISSLIALDYKYAPSHLDYRFAFCNGLQFSKHFGDGLYLCLLHNLELVTRILIYCSNIFLKFCLTWFLPSWDQWLTFIYILQEYLKVFLYIKEIKSLEIYFGIW